MSDHIARREKRTETSLLGTIRLQDGTEIPCFVKDVSPSGAKLGIPRSCELPERFLFKIKGREFVFTVRLVWCLENYAGVRIERISKLSELSRSASPAS